MRRREVLVGTVAAVAGLPVRALAQGAKLRRLAILSAWDPKDATWSARLDLLRSGLASRGWAESRTLQIDVGRAESDRTLDQVAQALVGSAPDVLFTSGTFGLRALQRATSTIPIVFVSVADPVTDGFVASLAQPGGNITGFSNYEPHLAGKWLELLKQLAPDVVRALIVFNPESAPHSLFLEPLKAGGPPLGLAMEPVPIRSLGELEAALAGRRGMTGTGVIAMPDTFISVNRHRVVDLMEHYRVPAIYYFSIFVEAGGLLSYGVDVTPQYSGAAAYIDRILRGETPARLPVQAPTKFDLAINLKSARSLGLVVPPSLLARADEVIE
jgi:putative ABC transport system substrate-binding protein